MICYDTGAPTDGFPPKYTENTFQAIQSTFRSLEMHSEERYKICICSVILGQLDSLQSYHGFSITFSKMLDAISENFSMISLSHYHLFLTLGKMLAYGQKRNDPKILINICFSEHISYRKQSQGAPDDSLIYHFWSLIIPQYNTVPSIQEGDVNAFYDF